MDELATSLDLAATYDDIRAVQAEVKQARSPASEQPTEKPSGAKGRKPQEKLPQPLRLKTTNGVPLLVGRTARQNDAATFRLAAPDDLWFHARGVPGAHVVVKQAGGREEPDEAVLEAAAELAAYYSANRAAGRVEVDRAARRDVRKIKGAGPGMVTYRNEQTLRVAPRSEDDLRRRNLLE